MAATPLSCFRTSPVVCSASSSDRLNLPKHDPTQQKGSAGWWTPIFGWSSDPDYIVPVQGGNPTEGEPVRSGKEESRSISLRSKLGAGCFTEEKAKELRRKTRESSNFHDIMYHSAIASRLASDVSERGGM